MLHLGALSDIGSPAARNGLMRHRYSTECNRNISGPRGQKDGKIHLQHVPERPHAGTAFNSCPWSVEKLDLNTDVVPVVQPGFATS